MKRLIYLIGIWLLSGFTLDFNPQPKAITQKYFPEFSDNIQTPALQKKKGYTNYQEMMHFLDSLQARYPQVMQVTFIGESQLGKKVPLVKLNQSGGQDKLRVWFQGGLHGNEMASTECVLHLLHQLLADTSLHYLFQKIEIAMVPMANIDGYEKQDRYAANGLDLNRDQTKLNIKESVFLKQTFSDYNPHVAIDFHEYNPFRKDFAQLGNYGVTSRYDVMFMSSGNLNVPAPLRQYTNEVFVANAHKALDKRGLTYEEYITSDKKEGEIHFSQGSNSARSSATSYALANTISTLVEIRGVGIERTSFTRRIITGYTIALSYLQTAYEQDKEIKEVLKASINHQEPVVVVSKKETGLQSKKFISLENNEEVMLEVMVSNASKGTPVLSRAYPKAYLITAENLPIIARLKILGIRVDTLTSDTLLDVEAYQVSALQKSHEKVEGVFQQKVQTMIQAQQLKFQRGTFVVYLPQENARLAMEVLEPEAPNSFVYFSVLPVSVGMQLPIYRYVYVEKK